MPIDPTLSAALALAVLGWLGLHRRLGATSPVGPAAGLRFTAGLVVLAVALGPALEDAAARSLAAHMVQHQLLVLVVGPLLATGGALRLIRGATGRPWLRAPREANGRAALAVVAAAVHLAVLLVWHVPAAYDAALASEPAHQLEHATMLGSAILAWTAIVRAATDDRAVFGALLGLVTLAVGGAVLGVVLLAAPGALYSWYGTAGIEDQRIAGALMKVGALLVYVGAAVALIARWFQDLSTAEVSAPPVGPRS